MGSRGIQCHVRANADFLWKRSEGEEATKEKLMKIK